MINKLAITNNVVIQKPQEIERPNNAPVQWNGKKVYVSHHDRHIWFTRIACPILIALGFTLIAAVGTMGAIFGGVTLIGFAGLAWLFLEVLHASSIYFVETQRREGEKSFSRIFGCRDDYKDLPEIEWEQDKKNVTIHLTQKEIDEHPRAGIVKGFVPICANLENHPFIVNLYPKDENKLDPIVFVYDRKLKGKTFKFNFDGHVIPLKEDPKRASAFMIKIVNLIDFEYEKI